VQHDGYELVHFNFAMAKRPLDHPDMAGFTSQLDAVNRLASASPGLVWSPADGEAADAVATFGSLLVLANMSTWRSLEDLRRFTYEGQHGLALKKRREWFDPPSGPSYVLWWVPAGYRPNWEEAKRRLDYRRRTDRRSTHLRFTRRSTPRERRFPWSTADTFGSDSHPAPALGASDGRQLLHGSC